jgi:alpha-beta hydrolase superfamily lysophospholipase
MLPLPDDVSQTAQRARNADEIIADASRAGLFLSRVRSGGVDLALWSAQAGPNAPSVLLLHGVTYSSLSVFDLAVPGAPRHEFSLLLTLAKMGLAAYALDAEGYGLSGARPEGSTLSGSASDLAAAIDAVSMRHQGARVALIGWSWGAQVAARFLSRDAPEAPVSHLVFWGSCWGAGPAGPPEALRGLEPPSVHRRVNTATHAGADFRTPGTYSPEVREAFVTRALQLDPTSPTLGLHAVARALPLHDPERIRVPVLAVHGEHDPMASPADLRDWLARIGNERRAYIRIAGADHNVQLSYARAALAGEITAFVRS